ncbi:MAG: hypothetical protein M1834_006615 [Cirrosporium novae-zelandiae]|nr:MAG: hypothetical protein M1834_006615 [Cirrosporium novae-zelandiae]
MTSALAAGPATVSHGNAPMEDPFLSPNPQQKSQHRYSSFDVKSFTLTNSPTVARRALQAHLAETERRITDASQLGTSLVQQRQEITERLKEIEIQQNDEQIGPVLKQKLADLEREYNEISRDAARAFLPKAKSTISENDGIYTGSLMLSSQATNSPSKISVPSRKQRNQPSNRVHDIEFATEISTSLLAQVRQLQALLAEKDEALKAVTLEKSRLELDAEGFSQRLRTLDESEQRYKDENWNLETQTHELMASLKEANEREQKLINSLKTATEDKTSALKDLDELKQTHGKLLEEKESSQKHNETEFMSMRKHMTATDKERFELQRTVEDLKNQNEHLAKAVATRFREAESDAPRERSTDNEDLIDDDGTIDNSPLVSPIKGTPRHNMLESETLKSSLHHAHRMIQNLKSNITREKSEKFELKRMLQEARDELDIRRGEAARAPGSATKQRQRAKSILDNFKKPIKPSMLGAVRSPKTNIVSDEPEWEDHVEEQSPTRGPAARLFAADPTLNSKFTTDVSSAYQTANETEAGESYQTANETEAEAFETAHEPETTESEAFQTGAEHLSDDSEELTETEHKTPQRDTIRARRPSPFIAIKPGDRNSFLSTASTSDGEEGAHTLMTPIQMHPPRYKLRMSRGIMSRRPRIASGDHHSLLFGNNLSSAKASPASITSRRSSNALTGQSLFAELGELNAGDSGDECIGTPARSNVASQKSFPTTPTSRPGTARRNLSSMEYPVPPLPKAAMVDSGMMTEPWEPSPKVFMSDASVTAQSPMSDTSTFVEPPTNSPSSDTMKRIVRDAFVSTEAPKPLMVNASTSAAPRPTMADASVFAETPKTPKPTMADASVFAGSPKRAVADASVSAEAPKPLMVDASVFAEEAPREIPVALQSVSIPKVEYVDSACQYVLEEHDLPVLNSSATQVVVDEDAVPEEAAPVPKLEYTASASQTIPEERNVPVVSDVGTQMLAYSQMEQAAQTVSFKYLDSTSQTTPEPKIIPRLSDVGTQYSPQEEVKPLPPVLSIIPPSKAAPSSSGDVPTSSEECKEDDTPKATAASTILGSVFGWNKSKATPGVQIAEDSPNSEPEGRPQTSRRDMKSPLGDISGNATLRAQANPGRQAKARSEISDRSSQTILSSQQIDKILMDNAKNSLAATANQKAKSKEIARPIVAEATASPSRPWSSRNTTASAQTTLTIPEEPQLSSLPVKRPGSANSLHVNSASYPPLPADHKQAIAAAQRAPTPEFHQSNMGPPLAPASAYRLTPVRPRTPNEQVVSTPPRGGTTPRARYSRSQPTSRLSRRSSVSSFASELDERFNIRPDLQIPQGLPVNTDPRMIQAITQTMIGEYLWKYTRKAGRGEMSANRHRRFFWVHPYTRTLYWSDRDPSTAGRAELKAKSVAIEAVRVITDDNPMPPGLHRKSLIVITPGRTVKFTATTGQRHETWFNALSYLLLRTNDQAEEDIIDTTHQLTSEDVDEFNPGYARSKTPNSHRQSLSSYNSHATNRKRASSMAPRNSHQDSTASSMASRHPTQRSISRLSNMFRGSFSSRRSRISGMEAVTMDSSIYEASLVHDSTEDINQEIETPEGDPDKLENVRACCDGRHDVSSLARRGGKSGNSHSSRHSHNH